MSDDDEEDDEEEIWACMLSYGIIAFGLRHFCRSDAPPWGRGRDECRARLVSVRLALGQTEACPA